jgi:hypothetical protein
MMMQASTVAFVIKSMVLRPTVRLRSHDSMGDGKLMESLLEFCYNVRYVERHRRAEPDPWSLRQSGIYQRHVFCDNRSIWILIQPSSTICRLLKEKLRQCVTGPGKVDLSPMAGHMIILLAAARTWNEYIDDLRAEADLLVCRHHYNSDNEG